MDMGNRMLHVPGPGDVQIILPPGSTSVPLRKVPSGHLVMIIDDFERVPKHPKGALPERTLQLHTHNNDQDEFTPGAASSQPRENGRTQIVGHEMLKGGREGTGLNSTRSSQIQRL